MPRHIGRIRRWVRHGFKINIYSISDAPQSSELFEPPHQFDDFFKQQQDRVRTLTELVCVESLEITRIHQQRNVQRRLNMQDTDMISFRIFASLFLSLSTGFAHFICYRHLPHVFSHPPTVDFCSFYPHSQLLSFFWRYFRLERKSE